MVSNTINSSSSQRRRIKPSNITDDSPNVIKGVGALLDGVYRGRYYQSIKDFHKFVIAEEDPEKLQQEQEQRNTKERLRSVENWDYGKAGLIDIRDDDTRIDHDGEQFPDSYDDSRSAWDASVEYDDDTYYSDDDDDDDDDDNDSDTYSSAYTDDDTLTTRFTRRSVTFSPREAEHINKTGKAKNVRRKSIVSKLNKATSKTKFKIAHKAHRAKIRMAALGVAVLLRAASLKRQLTKEREESSNIDLEALQRGLGSTSFDDSKNQDCQSYFSTPIEHTSKDFFTTDKSTIVGDSSNDFLATNKITIVSDSSIGISADDEQSCISASLEHTTMDSDEASRISSSKSLASRNNWKSLSSKTSLSTGCTTSKSTQAPRAQSDSKNMTSVAYFANSPERNLSLLDNDDDTNSVASQDSSTKSLETTNSTTHILKRSKTLRRSRGVLTADAAFGGMAVGAGLAAADGAHVTDDTKSVKFQSNMSSSDDQGAQSTKSVKTLEEDVPSTKHLASSKSTKSLEPKSVKRLRRNSNSNSNSNNVVAPGMAVGGMAVVAGLAVAGADFDDENAKSEASQSIESDGGRSGKSIKSDSTQSTILNICGLNNFYEKMDRDFTFDHLNIDSAALPNYTNTSGAKSVSSQKRSSGVVVAGAAVVGIAAAVGLVAVGGAHAENDKKTETSQSPEGTFKSAASKKLTKSTANYSKSLFSTKRMKNLLFNRKSSTATPTILEEKEGKSKLVDSNWPEADASIGPALFDNKSVVSKCPEAKKTIAPLFQYRSGAAITNISEASVPSWLTAGDQDDIPFFIPESIAVSLVRELSDVSALNFFPILDDAQSVDLTRAFGDANDAEEEYSIWLQDQMTVCPPEEADLTNHVDGQEDEETTRRKSTRHVNKKKNLGVFVQRLKGAQLYKKLKCFGKKRSKFKDAEA